MFDECLNCTLPICNEESPDCAFVQIGRPRKATPYLSDLGETPEPEDGTRSPYWRRYHKKNKPRRAFMRNQRKSNERLKTDLLAILQKIQKSQYDRQRYRGNSSAKV